MSDYSSPVKTTRLTSSGAIFAGPCKILSIYFVSTTTAGSITIKDGGSGGTSLAVFDTPVGGTSASEPAFYQIDLPGLGLRCETSGYATLSNVDKVTVIYG
jgi:hypothetical protein